MKNPFINLVIKKFKTMKIFQNFAISHNFAVIKTFKIFITINLKSINKAVYTALVAPSKLKK